ncbi:MAG: ArnT family glycosyltransferase [Thermoguttaceae bacterium]|jgi:4-amino-4-deoxy-L-arabinose transferase-like glycosyltransferase
MFFSSRFKTPFFLLFVLAFVIRGTVVLVKMDSFDADPDNYRALAENLRNNAVFGDGETPTAYRPPLYPVILRAVYTLTPETTRLSETVPAYLLSERSATALLHWILGVLTVLIAYKLALILTFPRKWAFAAALLTAIDPILLAQSRMVMTETLAAFLAVLIIWLLTLAMMPRQKGLKSFLGIGLLAGAAALCRPVFFGFGLLVFLGLLNYSVRRKLRFRFVLSYILGFAAVLMTWGVRNQLKMGETVFTTTHGGYTLYLANNRYLYAHNSDPGPFSGPWDSEEFQRQWESIQAEDAEQYGATGTAWELRRDELAYEQAHKEMYENPRGAFVAALVRFGNLWQFIPYRVDPDESWFQGICRYTVGVFYAIELSLALLGALHVCVPLVSSSRRRLLVSPYWSNWSWLMFLLIAVQLPHLLYWTNMRMRAPAMTIIPIFAVIGLRMLITKREGEPIVVGGSPTSEESERVSTFPPSVEKRR